MTTVAPARQLGPEPRRESWLSIGHRRDFLAIGFIIVCALVYLGPAFTSGPSFAPADLGRNLSVLTTSAATHIHNNINGDVIDQSVAWNTLNYTLVHHGQFPLWNTYAGNGLPQFLNFESSVLALPSLFGYLVPQSVSFLVTVLVKLLLAGLGTYWCARLLGLRPLPSCFAGSTFMLSGAFANWLGWSISGVVCWTGVILAGVILCYRAKSIFWPIAVLGVSIAFAIYGGFPEGYVLVAGTFVVFGFVLAIGYVLRHRHVPIRSIALLSTGCVVGIALSAPLWLPGLSVVRQSIRAGTYSAQGIPLHGILLTLAQGYDGLPTAGSTFFLARTNYFESAAYIGVIALVLAGCGLIARFRHPVVLALGITAVVQLLVIYQIGTNDPVQRLIKDIGLGSVATHRFLPLLAFVLALLAAYGLEELTAERLSPFADYGLGIVTAIVGAVLLAMWIDVPHAANTLCTAAKPGGAGLSPSVCVGLRRTSLYWPTALEVGLVGLVFYRLAAHLPRTADVHLSLNTPAPAQRSVGIIGLFGPLALLVLQSAYLLVAGVGINTYSTTDYPVTPATMKLASITRGGLVAQDGGNVGCPVPATGACGLRAPTGIDFYPNINIGYGIDELGMHDPIIPKMSFADWPVPNAGQLIAATNLFNPDVDSVALARDYGVSYVLVGPSEQPPAGMTKIATLHNSVYSIGLYHVPNSARFTTSSPARITGTRETSDRRFVVHLNSPSATQLVAHITDSPGWHAQVNGKSVPVLRGPTNDLVVDVPRTSSASGSTTVTFTYLPRDLVVGLVAVILSLLFLVGLGVAELVHRRSH